MKPPGKWISDLEADMPLLDGAHRVLDVRLNAVAQLLPLAAFSTRNSVELVHQLRIATRRAGAALEVFAPCVKPKRRIKMRRRLKHLRGVAAAARQCDVHRSLFEQMLDRDAGAPVAALEHLNRTLDNHRVEAQRDLAGAAQRLPPHKMTRSVQKLLRSLRDPSPYAVPMTLRDAAEAELPRLVAELREASQGDLSAVEDLHQLRIRGKRLRYAMEVLAPCLGPQFRDTLYRTLQELQDHLGPINDSHEIVALLQSHLAELNGGQMEDADAAAVKGGLAKLIELFTQRREALRAEFLRGWEADRHEGLMASFEMELGRLPKTPAELDSKIAGADRDAGPQPEIVTRPFTAASLPAIPQGQARQST